jgi:hypothetical protein
VTLRGLADANPTLVASVSVADAKMLFSSSDKGLKATLFDLLPSFYTIVPSTDKTVAYLF